MDEGNGAFAPSASPSSGEFSALGGFSDSSGVDGEGDGGRNLRILAAKGETLGESEGRETLKLTWVFGTGSVSAPFGSARSAVAEGPTSERIHISSLTGSSD